MVRKRLLWIGMAALALLATFVVLGAGSLGRPTEPGSHDRGVAPAADQLTLRTETHLFTLGTESGGGQKFLSGSVPAPDGSVVYTLRRVEPVEGERRRWTSQVQAIDTTTGRVLRETTLEGKYDLLWADASGLAGLSPAGGWLALQREAEEADGRTRFAVLDTAFRSSPRLVELDGSFSFDALSDDGSSLFLIEYLPEGETGQMVPYRVRFYDLRTDRLDPRVIADKRNAEQVMTGVRRMALPSANGRWLYSLYLNDHHGPFIHVLNLAERFALCIDLPPAQKSDWYRQHYWALAGQVDGRTLYAVNPALGLVAEIDTGELRVRRTAEFDVAGSAIPNPLKSLARRLVPVVEAKLRPGSGAALSPDGQTLYAVAEWGLAVISTRDLTLRARYLERTRLNTLALSPDGKRVYVVALDGPDAAAGRVLQVNAESGQVIAGVAGSGEAWEVLRVDTP